MLFPEGCGLSCTMQPNSAGAHLVTNNLKQCTGSALLSIHPATMDKTWNLWVASSVRWSAACSLVAEFTATELRLQRNRIRVRQDSKIKPTNTPLGFLPAAMLTVSPVTGTETALATQVHLKSPHRHVSPCILKSRRYFSPQAAPKHIFIKADFGNY